MSRQLSFDLPVRPALGREDFFVSPANAVAVATVEDWRNWPGGKLVLAGPAGSGKTHLAHVWAAAAGARVLHARDLPQLDIADLASDAARLVVEDADTIAGDTAAEQALFHLHNLTLAEGGALLLTGATPPRHWPLTLPDLASRMLGASMVKLAPPDDALLKAVLLKLFADRQLAVSPALVDYLLPRMERSHDGAGRLVAMLDRAALAEGRAVTRSLASRVLDKRDADAP